MRAGNASPCSYSLPTVKVPHTYVLAVFAFKLHMTFTIWQCRRQHKIVAPALFEAATSGNFAHAKDVLEEGDDLDVKVTWLINSSELERQACMH